MILSTFQNALDLTAPASDVLLKNRLKSWFQLSGHPDGFAPAGPGTVWKRKSGGTENTERIVYEALSKDDAFRDCIPRYVRTYIHMYVCIYITIHIKINN